MITFKQATAADELVQILQLQKENLPEAISSEEKNTEGFLTAQHDLPLLQKMNSVCSHTIAMRGDKVIGYALSMHPDFRNDIDILKPMFKEIDRALGAPSNETISKSYIVMGQICINKAFRKQGVFRGLYTNMKQFVAPSFEIIITEVDSNNIRSLNAHLSIGFKSLSKYHSDGRDWELIYFQ